ncbi:endonuclease III [Elizabethkingia meningoseptica]|uniref:Endonuclease III n=1 Tax=Elizabethkingia meningoseptica TaxID=238 RepID=A0A1V3TX25_ELIME|nr:MULTISPECIES: endonuclease III [Elizabethkingia]AQX04464.1 endonuclease III [Elizabethkingia meningoseptica]AQX11930.1 endonuclease III [Elizabethkingia meningoseptica]AQX46506.1 endonuclease III [Elizabethkingia meningoseptica]EJK5328598.1 endonuclease III [Elizabethkingia meningoseptica]EOR31536.1 putative EndoIII-related endonuclease [Elizabethkingia meningoseptica ATCC 13253 = NBRC 12535]
MTKKQRAETVMTELEKLYPQTPIPLDHFDPYTLLVAVALSAQTTDKKVNEITPVLFAKAQTPQQMARLEEFEIKELIKEIGLSNTKAKNLKRMAELLLERHEGIVPESFEELEALPGVGHKTASVVMSQAFGHPAFPVDTHIHRLMKQWKLSEGKNVEQVEADAKKLFPKSTWNKLHLQIIFYGREYSPARGKGEKDFLTKMLFEK